MFLKNENYLYGLLIIFFYLFSYEVYSNTDHKTEALNYLSSLRNFSSSFLQVEGENLSEGKIYIGEKRVRAEYFSPTKILIVLDEDKAMYYNYELDEEEFFNPKNTKAWYFYDIFRNSLFFENSQTIIDNNELILEKRGVDNEQNKYVIKVFFEKNPLVLRAIEVVVDDDIIKLSIFNHSYDENFDKKFFKLINPKFFD